MKTLERWDVEDPKFWDGEGKKIANRNLWISIPNLLCGFSVWLYWGMIAKTMQALHFGNTDLFNFTFGNDGQPLGGDSYRALLFNLPAIAGLAGATLRVPNSFMIALCGGRNVKFMTTLLLILPAIAAGFALQNPDTPFMTFVILAAFSGVGGGAFASSMSNISFFFPKRMQGLALGLNAGLGNAGVSVMQFLIPWAITYGMFGALGGDGYELVKGDVTKTLWIQNAALVWVPIMAVCLIGAFFFMNNLPQHNKGGTNLGGVLKYLWLTVLGFAGQFAVFRNKHTWVMTWLYTMTFGSFIGYANAFPKLIDDVFGFIRIGADGNVLPEAIVNPNAPVASHFIWIGAAVGALIRPIGGWLSDKWGGARVTQWDTYVMVAATVGAGYYVSQASQSQTPEQFFMPFLLLFILLFATTGIGNGSTFRMIPIIFEKEQAGPVLGWTSAIAAYGAFLIPKVFGAQIKAGHPEYALYGFAGYYASCLVVNWWFYARKNAEVPC